MGPFNGGGFGGSSGDAFSSSGSSGAFGSSSDQHRHDNVPISPYNDPYYYNNQRPYRESRSYGSGGHGGDVGGGRVCSIFLSFFAFVGTLFNYQALSTNLICKSLWYLSTPGISWWGRSLTWGAWTVVPLLSSRWSVACMIYHALVAQSIRFTRWSMP